MTVSVRLACQADYESLTELFAETNRFHAQRVPLHIRQVEPIITSEWLQETLSTPDQWLLVAQEEDHLLGLLLMQLRETPDGDILVPRRYLYVHELAVLESHRGQGIGRILMSAAQGIAAEHGIYEVELDVWSANAEARAFYEHLGFETVLCRMRKTTARAD